MRGERGVEGSHCKGVATSSPMTCPSRDELQVRKTVSLDVERNRGIRNGIPYSVSTIPNVLITHGVHMTKTLLILLLITMQLLAGSGASVYLCIGCDGSYGIETSTESCLCDTDDHADDESCPCDCDDRHCEHRETAVHVQLTGDGASKDSPCGCTHIPLIVSSSQSHLLGRSVANLDAGRQSFLLAVPPNNSVFSALASRADVRWHVARADVLDFSLTVVSTVVIRC